ncbi:MAG: tyrosine-type recombinase/integrase [Phycisphaeraceae bacterium]|nr:tyrosine-type recombinase/integrase [Phycisphaeraceae bacterium]MCW5753283.1 tyrosine-type recombinase/integrase [Phycisphaeraceae bacterium]
MARRVYLTNGAVEKCKAEAAKAGKPVVFTDDKLKGFLLKVSGESATFYVQRDVGGKAVRVALGRVGGKRTASDFRDLAEKVRGELGDANKAAKAGDAAEAARIVAHVRDRLERDGAPARPQARADAPQAAQVDADGPEQAPQAPDEWEAFTLAQAIDEHVANMKARNRARSVDRMRDEMARYLGEWMERPVASLTKRECIDRHRRITQDHGPIVANKAFRMLRAVWNSAAERFDADEHAMNPVRKFRKVWNEEGTRKPIDWAALPEWAARVNGVTNPVRRDWHWFVLLTGLRNEDSRKVRWEEVNLTDKPGWYINAQGERVALPPKSMHRPCPKGGERKAFTVPLSAPVVEILKRRKAENPSIVGDDQGWVFPTRDKEGRLVNLREPKEQDYMRDAAGKVARFRRNAAGEWATDPKGQPRKFTAIASAHVLRHTFASTADEEEVGVSERVMKALMNHTPDSANMNHRYNRPSMDAMRAATEKVAGFLIRKAGTGPGATNPAGRIEREAAGRPSRQASA